MNSLIKTTPVAYSQVTYDVDWNIVNQTEVAVHFDSRTVESERLSLLGVTDVSCFNRVGVKGKGASDWLKMQGVSIPENPNSWLEQNNTLILRLGLSEFFIEDQIGGSVCDQLELALREQVKDVYHVARADASFVICGEKVLDMFSELCKLDLTEKEFGDEDVLMTQIADISATISRQSINGKDVYRLWCDGTLGAYMWKVLYQLASEKGGGPVGFLTFFPNK
jgi:sarcosine oxidase subunit gamma